MLHRHRERKRSDPEFRSALDCFVAHASRYDVAPPSRHANASESCIVMSLTETEGAGNAGCFAHPQPCVRKVKKHTSVVTTGTPKRSGIPCAIGFNGFLRALSGDRAFLVTVIPGKRQLPKNLMPASRHQDHTTSPSAKRALVSRAQASIASRTPRFVTIAIRPSCRGGTARIGQAVSP